MKQSFKVINELKLPETVNIIEYYTEDNENKVPEVEEMFQSPQRYEANWEEVFLFACFVSIKLQKSSWTVAVRLLSVQQ